MATPKKTPTKQTAAKKTPAKKTAAKKSDVTEDVEEVAESATTDAAAAEADEAAVDEPAVDVPDADEPNAEEPNAEENDDDDEEPTADEADIERFLDAVAALDDDSLLAGLTNMRETSRQELAGQLNLPGAATHLGSALVPLAKRKLRAASPERQLTVAFELVEGPNDQTIKALGDSSENPTRDELLGVLPDVLETHGAPLTTLMMAAYAISDAECAPAMRELLETDERFAVPPRSESDTDDQYASPALPPKRATEDDPETEAKREARRAAKAARKAAEERARAAKAGAQAKRRAAEHQAKRVK